jgi:hypothetical protein
VAVTAAFQQRVIDHHKTYPLFTAEEIPSSIQEGRGGTNSNATVSALLDLKSLEFPLRLNLVIKNLAVVNSLILISLSKSLR